MDHYMIFVDFASVNWSSTFSKSFIIFPWKLQFFLTKYGVYDCIDFYKQPAFSHPLLKNLTSKGIPNIVEHQGSKAGGCPIGTIPILRTNSDSSNFSQPRSLPSNSEEQCVAVVHTRADLRKRFFGVDGSISIYKPRAQNTQWSSARVKLINANDYIEAGWMVNPDLFKDYEAHFYAKYMTFQTGCINLQCPGFVQVSKDVRLGNVPDRYSVVGGVQVFWNISIAKHQDDGNWWLSLIGSSTFQVGYWPKELFASLREFATQVEFGGEINSGPLQIQLPEMGNGAKAVYDYKRSAFILHATVVDESFKNVNPQDTEKFTNCNEPYTVLDAGYQGDYAGRAIFFGGPWNY
ncbi:uncharacterized protein LOC104890005 isoform X1 [Beta vulgaris subsp. vulgaris]|uniref:uncharacterized protein LOC104890005 isoform X1 n=1 Tax=Beta vulgaris subsp. vulgaris TaxID=3555 RepID=UPI0020371827|nr:uncharacterized protein LOC104890005 isoform X1 [Beta vulgaris subsp. vulgaris]